MTDHRAEWFAFYGVTLPERDPRTPLTPVAVITAEILLDCFRRAEIERLGYLAERNAQPSQWLENKRRENWTIFVRACFLLDHEPGQFENIDQHPLFSA